MPKFSLPTYQQNMKKRDADPLTITNPVDGIYNQLLFDLCGTDDLVSLSLLGQYNSAIDVIGVINNGFHRIVEDFITYVAPDGAASRTPSSGIVGDPCEPANSIESGGCAFVLEGWTRFRRSSPTRDITDGHMRYCQTQPIYDIGGNQISDDYEWDVIRLMTVVLQDFQRWFIDGADANAGETSGLWELIDFGYLNPITGDPCPEMDAYVVDWAGNNMCPDGGAVGVTFNGVPVADNLYSIIDFIKSYVTQVARRINLSSLSGAWDFIGLLSTEALSCLMGCYVCHTVCGGDITRMDSFEARARLEELRSQLGAHSAVRMIFDGYAITFFPYDYAMINVDGTVRIIIVVPTVGNSPVLRTQTKDMNAAAGTLKIQNNHFMVSDQSRVLHWENVDNTCYTVNTEMQSRIYLRAPWTTIKFDNILCDTIFGVLTSDPLSLNYLGGDPSVLTPHQTVVPPAISS